MAATGVALIVHSLEIGGLERVVMHLANRLSPAYRPVVFCLTVKGDFAAELENAGIEVIALGKKPGKDLSLPGRLARLFRQHEIKIVHAHNSGPMFTGTWAGKLAGIKGIIVTDHSRKFPERGSVVATEWVLARLVDEIVSVSELNQTDLIEKMHWPRRKITVIHNGVEQVPEIEPEQAAKLRGEFDLQPETPLVLNVARLRKQKNIHVLIEAARLLRERGVAAKIIVAGEGSERASLEQAIAAAKLEDRFILAGWRLDTLALYRIADLFVLSSNWEGLPMSLLEAMSARLPVVSTDVGDIDKALVPEQTGLTAPVRDPGKLAGAMAKLLTDRALRQAYGEAGYRIWRERFSVGQMVRQYEQLYARYA